MSQASFDEAIKNIEQGIRYKKCWKCGCQRATVQALRKQLNHFHGHDGDKLASLLDRAEAVFEPVAYDCLGCKVCFPAVATNALMEYDPDLDFSAGSCAPVERNAEKRPGWPPFPGNYQVLRYSGPVAVCVLNSAGLMDPIAAESPDPIGIIGTLNTENLGIERLVANVCTNPHIRFLVVAGADSEQKIGHLPGQSLASLWHDGMDENRRIIGAQGKRPVLKNIEPAYIDRFRKQVEIIDMIGCTDAATILETVESCSRRNRGTFMADDDLSIHIDRVEARPPQKLILDPNGYFVIFPDADTGNIVVEHYGKDGLFNKIIEGSDINAIYMTIIELDLVSRLDHASYLGKELARAEESLRTGRPYIQDRAQDRPDPPAQKAAGCGTGCC